MMAIHPPESAEDPRPCPSISRSMDRIVDHLRQRSQDQFFGRDTELRHFRHTLAEDLPRTHIFLIDGPGGVGKTALLEQMQWLGRQAGMDCIRIDGRDMEPSAYGVLHSLASSLGLPPTQALMPAILQAWRQQPRRLLLIDTFEHLVHLERWLRDQLLAELPRQSIVVLAGRHPPDESWTSDPIWSHGTQVIRLRNLSRQDCERVLTARGMTPEQCTATVRLSHGHPLTLMLLSELIDAHGEVPTSLGTDMIRRLTECFAAHAPSPLHRQALEVSACARVTTEGLLAAMTTPTDAAHLFKWLSSLSFMEVASEGLFPHDLVRDAIMAEMRWRHPEQLAHGAGQLLQHYLTQARTGGAAARHQAALNIFFMNRGSPVMRHFVDFAALGSVQCEPAAPRDQPEIAALTRTEMGPLHERCLHHWQGHDAATWWVVRDHEGTIRIAMLCLELQRLPPDAQHDDPALSQLQQWLDRQPPRHVGERVLYSRMTIARGGLQAAGIFLNALQTRTFSMWMNEPDLACFAMTVIEPEHWRPMMSHIDFHQIEPEGLVMDGQRFGTFAHDWRAAPLSDWLERMGASVLYPDHLEPPLPAGHGPQRLSESDFKNAVHEALRHWHDPVMLGRNPLLSSALLQADRGTSDPAWEPLRRLIRSTADSLSAQPRQTRFMRAIELTYWRPAGSQELAAERLGIPFGTYRYQLRMGVERLAQALWLRENDRPHSTPRTTD